MDETLKILVATLSGFVIAFFAEPMKIYFQNRNKIQNLRIALYKEIYHNYMGLKTHAEIVTKQIDQLENMMVFANYFYRTECYKQAITQELTSFYQLKEATMINALYIDLNMVLQTPKLKNGKDLPINAVDWMGNYMQTIANELERGCFDKRLMSKIATKQEFEEMRKYGKALKELQKAA
jgi:hypothetical protein